MKLLLLRPYFGVTINSDMQGDLGVIEYSPIIFPDLSLVYAATIASENSSVELDVIDANSEKLLFEDVEPRLSDEYDTIILKATAPTIKSDINLAKYLKTKYTKANIVMAGHVSKLLKNWISKNVKEIDQVVELPLEDFVYQLINHTKEHIDINDLPIPNFKLFAYQNFIDGNDNLRACLHMSRGCVVGCSYCPYAAFYGKKFEQRSIDKVIEDIKSLLALGVTYIQFRDQFFTSDKKRVEELCNRIINEGLKFTWSCETKLETLKTELIDIMVDAGMKTICFGVESASKKILNSYNRPDYDLEKLKNLISYLNNKNVDTLAFYIIGFPDDTWNSIQDTYNLATFLDSKLVKFSIYTPFIQPEDSTIELTPDSFVPFKNTMSIESCKNLTNEEIDYLADELMIMYHTKSNGLKEAYHFHYKNQIRYSKKVKMLNKKLNNNPIFN